MRAGRLKRNDYSWVDFGLGASRRWIQARKQSKWQTRPLLRKGRFSAGKFKKKHRWRVKSSTIQPREKMKVVLWPLPFFNKKRKQTISYKNTQIPSKCIHRYKDLFYVQSQQITTVLCFWSDMLSFCLHPPLISCFPCSAPEGGGFSPSLTIPNESLCMCASFCVLRVCSRYICVYYWIHWASNGCGCFIVLPWIRLDFNLENSIMSCLPLWIIFNKEIL